MAASEPGSSPIEAIQPSEVSDWRRVDSDPESERGRRIEVAAVHLVAALRRRDPYQAVAAMDAMFDEGLKLSDIMSWCRAEGVAEAVAILEVGWP